jgi:hypothetical protein
VAEVITHTDGIRIDVACMALDHERCTLFGNPKRPAMRARYLELPGQLIEGCSYTLEEVA